MKKYKKISKFLCIMCVMVIMCSLFCIGVSAVDENVTDLTGYTWIGNSTVVYDSSLEGTYNVDIEWLGTLGTSGTCDCIEFTSGEFPMGDQIVYVVELSYGYFYSAVNSGTYTSLGTTVLSKGYNGEEQFYSATFTGGEDVTNGALIAWLEQNGELVPPPPPPTLLDTIFELFISVGQWISGAAASLVAMFWTGEELTFVGMLAVAGLAFSVAFLIIGLISRFMHFRG